MTSNPNLLCPSCGKPTKTLSRAITSGTGAVLEKAWTTKCNNVHCVGGWKYEGAGVTSKLARADYGLKFDDDFNEIKR